MRRKGFTLIELLVVVAIIGLIVSVAMASLSGGRDAAHVRDASRAVVQMSRYAGSLALLRQRPAVVTYRRHSIEVRLSGDSAAGEDAGSPAAPIYMEVDGQEIDQTPLVVPDDPEAGAPAGAAGDPEAERKAFFFTRSVLDPAELAKEDATRAFEDVCFTVEVLGEDGRPLDPDQALALSLPRPARPEDAAPADDDDDDRARRRRRGADADEEEDIPISVTYETNGNCTPYRVIVRAAGASEDSEGSVVEISRSGRPQIEEEKRR